MTNDDVSLLIYDQAVRNYQQYVDRCRQRMRQAQDDLDNAVLELQAMEQRLARLVMQRRDRNVG